MPEQTTMVTKVREGKPSAFSVIDLNFAMKEIAEWALNIAALRGASYADARIVDERSRALATKNGRMAVRRMQSRLELVFGSLQIGAGDLPHQTTLARKRSKVRVVRAWP